MAYIKPGVLINQVQETISPALIEPDLYAGVVGRPYYVFNPGQVSYDGYWVADNGNLDIDLAGLLSAQFPNISGAIDEHSIYIDLIGVSGVQAGRKLSATYNNATGAASADYDASYDAGTLTISGTAANSDLYTGTAFRVNVGFRALRYDLQKAVVIEGGSDIQDAIGPVTVFNELGAGIALAASNSNRMAYAYGVTGTQDDFSTREAAQEALSTKDVYVYAPMTSNWGTAISDWKEFAESQSLPENKKETLIVAAPEIEWRAGDITDTANTSKDIASRAAITQSRRLLMVHPDVAYVRENLHISQIKQSYLKYNIGDNSSLYDNYGLYALLVGSITLSDGTKYFKDDEITDTVWQKLYDDGIRDLTVLVPVPGYMLAPAIAGQISGEDPEQPLTNIPIAGIERVKYSSDWFSDNQLNTMAEGGTYIMVQDQVTLPIYCRHQLTTDTTSVETREVSINKSVDFTAKFLRRNIKNLIGRNNITDQFIKTLKVIMTGIGVQLVRDGVLADFNLLELKQDESQRDKVKVKISILAQYPSNYIEIDLIY